MGIGKTGILQRNLIATSYRLHKAFHIMKSTTIAIGLATILSSSEAFTTSNAVGSSFVARTHARTTERTMMTTMKSRKSTQLSMVDNVALGGAIAVGGFAVGIGMVAFAENQGERAKERGSGLSESMSTKIAGSLMEDVEVDSVSDLSSLTTQLEAALKETKGDNVADLEMTEEDKKRIAEEADDGW